MSRFAILVPGLGFSFGFILVLLGIGQLCIYFKTKYLRSRAIAFFCFLASLYCFLQFFVQTRNFSNEFILFYTLSSSACIGFSRFYYMNAICYFIAVPDRQLKFYYYSNFILGVMIALPFLSYLVGGPELMFHSNDLVANGNYFSDSFSLVLGQPTFFSMAVISAFGLLDIYYSFYIFTLVRKTSVDIWLMLGLMSTFLGGTIETFFLPFTLKYYVPILFTADLFESVRMSYLSLKEYLIEREIITGTVQRTVIPIPLEKYQNSNLSDMRIQVLGENLKKILEEKTLYTNANLKLEKVANVMGIPSYQLSQVINSGLKTNFNDLINSYRIQAIKDKLTDPSAAQKTISEIAYENGYNSKSTFNTAFKKVTGKTPSQFRKEHTP